jgi:hypothetical protein
VSETPQEPVETPTQHWARLLSEQVARGKSRNSAASILARRYPELHRAMLAEANAGRPHALAAIERRFAKEV